MEESGSRRPFFFYTRWNQEIWPDKYDTARTTTAIRQETDARRAEDQLGEKQTWERE
jgi:hypothetical protein